MTKVIEDTYNRETWQRLLRCLKIRFNVEVLGSNLLFTQIHGSTIHPVKYTFQRPPQDLTGRYNSKETTSKELYIHAYEF